MSEPRDAAKVQDALYRIAELVGAARDMQEFYAAVHAIVGELMYAENFFIALYDEERQLINWPYYVDEADVHPPDPNVWTAFGEGYGRGLTAYVLRTGRPQLLPYARQLELVEQGEIELVGGIGEDSSWIGAPLQAEGKTVGVLVVQSYSAEHQYTQEDRDLLAFVAQHVGAALSRARAIEETRQRNAELALINSVQAALAGELNLQAIYDLVGEKIREVFEAQTVMILMLDETTGQVVVPYSIERGERQEWEPMLPRGFSGYVLETREPLMINEDVAGEVARMGIDVRITGDPPKSVLFVPLLAAGRATGVISLQNVDREHAFTETDQRLLVTLAGSLSVALDNARLVHETRQRNAELALINSVQEALAGELELQAIYNVVGDKIGDVFDSHMVQIAVLDESDGLVHSPYLVERGTRIADIPRPLSGFRRALIERHEPLVLGDTNEAEVEQLGMEVLPDTERPKSALWMPLVVGGKGRGWISLQNLERDHAFSESDVQLLGTLAASLGVALENARLVHETRQRIAELGVINSVQGSIAGELDQQAIYDVVGDKLREVFDAQVVDIAILDESDGLIHFPYIIERGVRLPAEPREPIGFRKHVLDSREPLAIHENMNAAIVEYGNPAAIVGEESHGSAIFQPLVVGGRAAGVISVQNLDKEHAFSPSDQQLLSTIAGSLGVALENAQLVQETRQRVAELGTVNSVGQALASQLDLDALIHLVGERVRETFDADITYVALHDEAAGVIEFPYNWELGKYIDEPPMPYGQGLTSQIIESGEPLLVDASAGDRPVVGTPSKSYLGVPIWAGDRTIGVLSVQSTNEQGRYGEADAGLLATLAANVGVAIQNARLFAEIERQREYFESLVEISPVAVIAMDADERVTSWNPAAAALFGYTADEAIGRPVDDLVFGDESREEGREVTREALATGRAQRITRRGRKDGTRVDVELMLVPLEVAGERLGFLGVYHDITELQNARQEAEAATQAKSAFLATMSHEIRTPMNAVIGMTGLLLGTDLTPEQHEFAEVVRASGDALLHVIDDILDYSKIEAGKLELEREPFDLRECVEGALDIIAPRAAEKGLELGALFGGELPPAVAGDVARLRQVLLNLLSNAVKFTDDGEVVVDVDAEAARAGWHHLHLVVRDTGIGIPPDRMDRLFESFSQVDASTTRRYGGTGLGLAISKRLVELMGGRLWVESQEGKGSSFHIELTAEEAELPARPSFDGAQPQLEGKRLLVVDDNATNREIVSRQVRSWGMEAVPVELPSQALQLIEAGERFDVAVLDMVMPEMDGRELAREIRRHRGERELPLVLVTSLGRLPQARTADEFAAQLAKPLKASQLFDALMRVLAAQQPDRAVREAPEGAAAASPLRILLAEDSAVNQKVALALLDKLGYHADVASNGLEALAALERRRYDVVLMDVQMPELDGLDTARRICTRWANAERPRIIAMTANALQEDRDACFAAGMDDYVAKPIRPEALAEALRKAQPLAAG
jgi:PAS domain S-box-containing protein